MKQPQTVMSVLTVPDSNFSQYDMNETMITNATLSAL